MKVGRGRCFSSLPEPARYSRRNNVTNRFERKTIQVLAVISEIPNISALVNSLYDCRYRDFMVAVVELNTQLESDRYFARHSTYLVRELRILAYTQVWTGLVLVCFWFWEWF